MTEREKTCTDHLHDALAALDTATTAHTGATSVTALQRAYESVEKALSVIQVARCEAQTAMDKF